MYQTVFYFYFEVGHAFTLVMNMDYCRISFLVGVHSLSTGTFEGLRGLFDSPLQESIEIMEYLGLYSPNLLRIDKIFDLWVMMKAMSMMVTFIHHGPRSLATIRETGLPGDRGRLEPVTEIVLFPPNSYELIPSFSSSKLPNAIGAVSITIGLQVAQASHLASS
ncbi:hypothetical protein P692DRAFT_20819863 [Suillus brevipes Sb2]|nr:hypothetical protein P692DRAFT_20819863 [Suillus brevipes Sb2]